MKIVNVRSGNVIMEDDNGKGCGAVLEDGWTYNDKINCICK